MKKALSNFFLPLKSKVMRLSLTFSLLFLTTSLLFAQVPQTVVVEHFTNTRCSICASRNPGFYANLANQDNTIHIAFHPSSPYPSCLLNEYNMTENDGRTNYYGLFGSTPDFVIQGNIISPSSNFSSPALFTPFQNQTTPVSIQIRHSISSSSVTLRATIITEAPNSLGNLRLFAALKEDVLNYQAPNGENVHYDVFRDSYFSVDGTQVSLAETIGDSVVLTASLPLDANWDLNNISSLLILQQEDSKAVVQAAEFGINEIPLSISKNEIPEFKVFPNPSNSVVNIIAPNNSFSSYEVFSTLGNKLKEGGFTGVMTITVSDLPKGIYFLQIRQSGFEKVERLVVQ